MATYTVVPPWADAFQRDVGEARSSEPVNVLRVCLCAFVISEQVVHDLCCAATLAVLAAE